jgi:hypothetical protein
LIVTLFRSDHRAIARQTWNAVRDKSFPGGQIASQRSPQLSGENRRTRPSVRKGAPAGLGSQAAAALLKQLEPLE